MCISDDYYASSPSIIMYVLFLRPIIVGLYKWVWLLHWPLMWKVTTLTLVAPVFSGTQSLSQSQKVIFKEDMSCEWILHNLEPSHSYQDTKGW